MGTQTHSGDWYQIEEMWESWSDGRMNLEYIAYAHVIPKCEDENGVLHYQVIYYNYGSDEIPHDDEDVGDLEEVGSEMITGDQVTEMFGDMETVPAP